MGDKLKEIATLKATAEMYLKKHDFKPGDIVTWKPGMNIFHRPGNGQPAVVIDVNPDIVNTSADPNSAFFHDSLSIRIGLIDEDGDFIMYWMDANRFEPYENNEMKNMRLIIIRDGSADTNAART